MTIHHLKIQRQPFEDLVSGRKTGEVRNCSDREFREGDYVELFLTDETGNPANKSIVRTITHIQRGYGLPDDICVLSYADPVVERQPVAWSLDREEPGHLGGYCSAKTKRNNPGWDTHTIALYAEQPTPVAVVLPERLKGFPAEHARRSFYEGWNACLDKINDLNSL